MKNPTTDFADWISPILVKELRQGMRTKVFVLTFILLQVLMGLNVIVSLVAASQGAEPNALGAFFWAMIGIPILLILPMTGLGAVSGEMKERTLELVFLTRLSAWRIVWGKWFAIIAQTALFICAVLPYVVLRYFMGGVNLVDDLVGIAWMFAGSAVLTAIMVGISPFQSRVTRVLVWIGLFLSLQFVPMFLFGFGMSGAGMPSLTSIFWLTAIFVIFLIALMLQIGTGRIAPPSENHSAIKRGIGLLFFLVALVSAWLLPNSETVTVLAMAACVPILTGAVIEPERDNLSIYSPFARRGFVGRIAGRFLYAGWPAGVLFAMALLTGFALLLMDQGMLDDEDARLRFVAFCGCFAFAAAVVRIFFPRTERPLGIFIAIQALGAFLALLTGVLDESLSMELKAFVSFLPPSGFAFGLTNSFSGADSGPALVAVCASTGASVAMLIVFMVRAWSRMSAMESQSLREADELA